jgi:hypothetical protein
MQVEYLPSDEDVASIVGRDRLLAGVTWLLCAILVTIYICIERPRAVRVLLKKYA